MSISKALPEILDHCKLSKAMSIIRGDVMVGATGGGGSTLEETNPTLLLRI